MKKGRSLMGDRPFWFEFINSAGLLLYPFCHVNGFFLGVVGR
jgi:hypothetical protein